MVLPDKVDLKPLVAKLSDRTLAGKIAWQTTAAEGVFAATVGEGSFRVRQKDVAPEWDSNVDIVPFLDLFDGDGKLVWSVSSHQVEGGLGQLYELAQRVANKVDERIKDMMSALDDLD